MRIYGLKNCDSCRAALRELGAAGHAAVLVDLRETPLSGDLRDRALAQFGAALINRRSTTWKGLDEGARAADPVALLVAYPAVMKRPLIDAGGQLYLGWDAGTKAALLG
ncbi:arsenate reductase family protein [Roseicyclus sp.]|uniref:arsenate reductase family protein n=1 Tax=Roseicyclus sp. TaxID=1914329 RepID=UPI001BD125A9|nr:ArsC/Spx/MgsR family protein [Roseicyclus sp.]